MKVEVIMPQMGESIVEGTVVEWLKAVGDTIRRDEDIFTISTDKVDAEIPSPAAGVLVQILADVGETVEVGAVCAYIETDAAAATDAAPASKAEAAPAPEAKQAAPAVPTTAPVAKAPSVPEPADNRPSGEQSKDELKRSRSTPLVRKMAAEQGIADLSVVPGTGSAGRVTKKDLLKFIEGGGTTKAAAVPFPPALHKAIASSAGKAAAKTVSFDGIPAGWEPALIKPPRVHLYDNDRVEPMGRMRSSIAMNMVQSRRNAAHCNTLWEIDVTAIVKARKAMKADYADRGARLTYTPFFIAAVVAGLREYPLMNAAIDGDNIVYRGSMNVGVASSIEGGLIVPVIKHADSLNLLGVARAVNDLGHRAKNRQLRPDDVSDGTFTVSNAGVWGSLVGIPILVSPQVGILGIGGIKKRVIADDDDNIRIRSMITMCLTFDHRLVDGSTADGFMSVVSKTLESWSDHS